MKKTLFGILVISLSLLFALGSCTKDSASPDLEDSENGIPDTNGDDDASFKDVQIKTTIRFTSDFYYTDPEFDFVFSEFYKTVDSDNAIFSGNHWYEYSQTDLLSTEGKETFLALVVKGTSNPEWPEILADEGEACDLGMTLSFDVLVKKDKEETQTVKKNVEITVFEYQAVPILDMYKTFQNFFPDSFYISVQPQADGVHFIVKKSQNEVIDTLLDEIVPYSGK